jgi:hypothetical protein
LGTVGKPIVYCGSCGKSLREEEFTRGKAHLLENTPFCTKCRPLPQAAAPPAEAPAEAVHNSIPSRSALPTPVRLHDSTALEDSSSKAMMGGVALALLGALLLIGFALNTPSTPSLPVYRPPTPIASPPAPEPPRPPAPLARSAEEQSLAAIRNLEAFASSSSDPDAILERCRETRAALAGTPYLSRVDALEQRAREARVLQSRDRQLTMTLWSAQRMRDSDPRFERREEIQSMLRAAIGVAGARKAEVEQILEEYRKACAEFLSRTPEPPSPAPPATPPPPPPVPHPSKTPVAAPSVRLGPYDLDDGAVRNWLVLGPFGARKDRQALYDHDLLKTEIDHVPAAGSEVTTREGAKASWTPLAVADGKILFRTIEFMGLSGKPQDPALAFAACWLNVEKETPVKFRIVVDSGFMLWLDHKRIWNHPKGQGLAGKEDVMPALLGAGPHLIVLKVLTIGGDFGFRLRVTAPGGERVSGIRVWNQAPVAQKILFAENFNLGRGPFIGGEPVAGGVDGTPALAVPRAGARIDGKLPQPSASTWTLRFKAKPLRDLTQFEVLIWSGRPGESYWYHVRGLKKDEWTQLEVKASQLNRDWFGKGPTFEGDTAASLKFYFDDAAPDGSMLIDDVEISE